MSLQRTLDHRSVWVGVLVGDTSMVRCLSRGVARLGGWAGARVAVSSGDHLSGGSEHYFRRAGAAIETVAASCDRQGRQRRLPQGSGSGQRTTTKADATTVVVCAASHVATGSLAASDVH